MEDGYLSIEHTVPIDVLKSGKLIGLGKVLTRLNSVSPIEITQADWVKAFKKRKINTIEDVLNIVGNNKYLCITVSIINGKINIGFSGSDTTKLVKMPKPRSS